MVLTNMDINRPLRGVKMLAEKFASIKLSSCAIKFAAVAPPPVERLTLLRRGVARLHAPESARSTEPRGRGNLRVGQKLMR